MIFVRRTTLFAVVLAILAAVVVPRSSVAQLETVCAEADTLTLAVGAEAISFCYEAEPAHGRPVFGYPLEFSDGRWVVPYDTLWKTGILFRTPVAVQVAGVELSPGAYSVYAVPSSFEWTLIFNRDVNHASNGTPYEQVASQEVGRGLARSMATHEYLERLTLSGGASGPASSVLTLAWERTAVTVPIRLAANGVPLACRYRGTPDRLAGRPSPFDSVDVEVGGRVARVCYGRPSARERTVFGGVVPFDDMWRLGANEPTVLQIPFAASIAGIDVEPGEYTLLAVPSRTEWTIVVTASTNQWGRVETTARGARSQYSEAVRAREMGRALVPSERLGEHVEQFTIAAEPSGQDAAHLVVDWERTRVRIPVRAR